MLSTLGVLTRSRGGLYVVFEGIDGAGKTTLIRSVAAALREHGREVVVTKEPTDGPLGRKIRELAATGRGTVTPEEELALFHEDRRIHVAEVVRPALAAGHTVLQDRSYFSTLAYQGDRGLDPGRILEESLRVAEEPDVLFVVDVPAEVALERIRRTRGADRDDFEALDSLRRVSKVFRAFAGMEFVFEKHLIDGTLLPDVMLERVLSVLEARRQSP
ncbi:MAG: dTMP kinase [Deltaproteobacteria bacterium]|nr:dTMP kinase [Deltaproteobacteria bacterium]